MLIFRVLRCGGTSEGNPQGIDRESTEDERSEKDLWEHGDGQETMENNGTGPKGCGEGPRVSCTAAEDKAVSAPNLL